MKRRVQYGAAAVAGLLAAYYATPFLLIIISLGEICPYSPSGTSLCAQDTSAPTKTGPLPLPRTSPEPVGARLCKEPGIRYAGATAEGAEVCFTLSPDRTQWVEIGFTFVPASGCPHKAGTTSTTGKTYYEGPDPLTGPGRISVSGFTGTIRGARASGVLEDPEICGTKTFRWSARRAP
jgi:hypothetical protein